MPSKSLKFCNQAGCRELTKESYCDIHMIEYEKRRAEHRARHDRTRLTSSKRGYGGKWRAVRLRQLKDYPLCKMCEDRGNTIPAVLVHHIKPLSEGGERLNRENLMSLCNECHEIIHNRKRKA